MSTQAQLSSLTIAAAPVDSRYFLAPVAGAGWLAGILLASALQWPTPIWLALALPAIAAAVLLWRRGRIGLALAACGALALGGARWAVAQPPFDPGRLHYYNGARDIVALGEIAAEPEWDDTRTRLRVAVRQLLIDGTIKPVEGLLLVETGRYPERPYGATLRLTGDLTAPITASPSYTAYLAREGLLSAMAFPHIELADEGNGAWWLAGLLRIKARGREVIQRSLPEPHAALLTGILLGDSSGIPRPLREDFRTTGMTHIIAISGFNIAVIIALLDRATTPFFPRRLAAAVIMLFIALYAALVGGSASVVRAAIMGIAYLTSLRLLGRPALAVSGLFTAAFLMTLVTPGSLWDVGFQLSFAATLGLMLYAGPWSRRLDRGAAAVLAPDVRGRATKLATELVVVTLAAQVLTLPLLVYYFGRLSLVTLPANVLILPAQTGVMVSGGVMLLAGFVLPAAGQLVGLAAWPFLHYTIEAVRLLARVPGASIPFTLSSTGLWIVYGAIAAFTLLATVDAPRRRAFLEQLTPLRRVLLPLSCLALIGVGFIVWATGRADGHLHVAFLDVGQGDAIFIQTPAGRQLLVDGGQYPSVLLDQLGRQMPFWDRSIDVVIATHPDTDHVAGLVSVLERYRVGRLITNGLEDEDEAAYVALLTAADERDAPIIPAQTGETILLDDGVRLEILHAGATGDRQNDASVVARLTYGALSVLLTGDAEAAAEAELLNGGRSLSSVILKAGHHGANTSSGEPFLRAVAPRVIVISAGRDNSYGHPAPAMLARAEAVGATVLRTDEWGTLEVTTDGRQMWWAAEHAGLDTPLP